MNIFLSWSGEQSQLAGEAVREWLPFVINAVKPWHSREDIYAGKRWGHEIQSKLEETQFGILFVTQSNFDAPWLLFEAGALARKLENTFVCPYLLNFSKITDLPTGPLAQFQAKVADKEGTLQLVKTINSALKDDDAIPDTQLADAFEMYWPRLEEQLENLPSDPAGLPVERNQDEMIEEILSIVRRLDRNEPDLSSVVRIERSPSISSYTNKEIYDALKSVRFNNLKKSIDWDEFSKMIDETIGQRNMALEMESGGVPVERSKDDNDPQSKE